jgi:GGDEF domain-containing protein
MILADVDEFRKVNDTGGNQFGDSVLKEITNVLTKRCKDPGARRLACPLSSSNCATSFLWQLMARYGGVSPWRSSAFMAVL